MTSRSLVLQALCWLAACAPAATPPLTFTAATFNTGTSEMQLWTPDSGYGPEQARLSDLHYGDGLAWLRTVEDARRFLAETQPDLIGFQEIFHSPDCVNVPATARAGWVCETWKPGDPTVAQVVLGSGYQVGCNLEKPDKCLGVKRSFGSLRGCSADHCLDALAGSRVQGCGSGSRVGRGVIDLVDGGTLTVVHVHGTSGVSVDDQHCRRQQVEQIFVDFGLGDGPAANGARNVILGDFNTDPARFIPGDVSAVRWRDFTGSTRPFHFITAMSPDAPGSYGGILNIDHVVADRFTGSCWIAGVTEGHPRVTPITYFDHLPHVCRLEEMR